MLGKKLYKTSMLNLLRGVILLIQLFLLNDFYLDTFTYEKFQADGKFKILDVIDYHYHYPQEFIVYLCLIVIPAIYYCLLRGTRFFEKGFVFNRGLPFFNRTILYEEIKSYKLLHPQKVLAIHAKNGEVYLVADNELERVIAILDQHHIQGDLAQDEYVRLIKNYKKFVLLVVSFTLFIFALKKTGLLK